MGWFVGLAARGGADCGATVNVWAGQYAAVFYTAVRHFNCYVYKMRAPMPHLGPRAGIHTSRPAQWPDGSWREKKAPGRRAAGAVD